MNWRARLREAIDRSGMKHSLVALDARITPETLSRILTAEHQRPSLDTLTRIAHAAGENVGWILGESGFTLSAGELTQLREVVSFLGTALLNAPLPHTTLAASSNALPVKVRRRDIPRLLAALGARAVYQLTDDSLAPLGALDGDLIYVRPLSQVREAIGRLAVCNLRGEAFAKVLELDGGRLRLVSPSERYEPIEAHEGEFRLVGLVVGRLAEML
jgi:transcriptional regulator with XRE-family HTH domain